MTLIRVRKINIQCVQFCALYVIYSIHAVISFPGFSLGSAQAGKYLPSGIDSHIDTTFNSFFFF